MELLNDEKIQELFLSFYTAKYGEDAAKDLLERMAEFTYTKAVAQAQLDQDRAEMEYWREKCYNDTMSAKKSGWDDCRKFYKTKMVE